MFKLIAKLFGTKSEKDIKLVMPLVQEAIREGEKLLTVSNDELRNKTTEIQVVINTKLKAIDDQLAALHQQIADNAEMDLNEKEQVFARIARRFKENEYLEVTAHDFDIHYAATHENVKITGDKAQWYNKWMAAGNLITWDMVHYEVQIIGGVVLHEGKIAEMATGEGKTLVATFPAFLNALAKRGVHIVTVNDYLARRDCEWMGPLFEFHGLKCDCIDKHEPNSPERRNAYRADITYGTNNEFGFDYLRDNMAREPEELVQRGHHYAMVDEVDSVLVDEARTPLIISGPIPRGDEHEFYDLKPRISKLVDAQKKLVNQFLNDAKKMLAEGNEKEGGVALFRTYRGMPKYKPVIKFLSESGTKNILQKQ